MGETQTKGQQAENFACEYLRKQGLRLVCKNFHCRYGEVDLIMQHGDTMVFVEVRSRKTAGLVDGQSSIDWRKQQKLQRSAEYYIQQKNIPASVPARIDVIALARSDDKSYKIDWIQNAIEG